MGTILNFVVEPQGKVILLAGGLLFAVLAILSLSYAHKLNSSAPPPTLMKVSIELGETPSEQKGDSSSQDESEADSISPESLSKKQEKKKEKKELKQQILPHSLKEGSPSETKEKPSFLKGIVLCFIAGTLVATWSPPAILASKGEGSLNSYVSIFYVTLAAVLSTPLLNLIFLRWPLTGDTRLPLKSYFSVPWKSRAFSYFGALVWTIGTTFYFLSAKTLGFPISYSLGQSAPLISVVVGILVWKEFRGATKKTWVFLVSMFVCYVAAISLIANAR